MEWKWIFIILRGFVLFLHIS